MRPRKPKRFSIPTRVKKMHAEGWPNTPIAQELGIPEDRVMRILETARSRRREPKLTTRVATPEEHASWSRLTPSS